MISMKETNCPGLYCGRYLLENQSLSSCGPCPRGYRINESSICIPCQDEPIFYDWLYLGFMALLPVVFHIFCIDHVAPLESGFKFEKPSIVIHICAVFEVSLSAFLTFYLADPVGEFKIRSCNVVQLSDWYTLLHNPTPNFEVTIHCTQEAVYPLYTMVFIFYAFCVSIMVLVRPWLVRVFLPITGKDSIYDALYFYPFLALLHAVFGGLIYYSFPYIIIILSVISNAIHFAYHLDQSLKALLLVSVSDLRNIISIFCHWGANAYGIIALTELKDIPFHYSLLALVPVPAVFYLLTARFTDPAKLHAE